MTAISTTTIKQWLKESNLKLKQAGVESYDLDSLILLEHVLETNRASLLAHQEDRLIEKNLNLLNLFLAKRINREPLAYITGKKDFFGRYFFVDSNVLIPRPESESFIELLKKHGLTKGSLIDVGCGSGILGITAKLEAPKLKVTLSDISNKALIIAEKNALHLGADVVIKNQSLFNDYYDVVFANLPYVPEDMKLERELNFEPSLALFAREEGLKIYRYFCKQVAIDKPLFVFVESLETQQGELTQMMTSIGYDLLETDGLVQLYKLVR